MSTLTIELTDEAASLLEAASKGRRTTPAQLAAELVAKSLPLANAPEDSADSAFGESLMGWCGVGASGIPDLATNPRHLEGFGAD